MKEILELSLIQCPNREERKQNHVFWGVITLLLIILMSQVNFSEPCLEDKNKQASSHSSQAVQSPSGKLSVEEQLGQTLQNNRNRRWSQTEHILYILFLQENRQKIKSKLIRRSNSFFKDMSIFIVSKSPTQCRSYHQKYETRYKFPHRIIREEKDKLDVQAYQLILAKTKEKERERDAAWREQFNTGGAVVKREPIQTQEFSCQTDIMGISTIFVRQDQVSPQSWQEQTSQQTFYPYMQALPFLHPYFQHLYLGL